MSNKKLIAVVMSALILMPTAAFAKGNPNSNSNSNAGKGLQQIISKDKGQAPSTHEDKETSKVENENKGAVQKQANEVKKDAKKQEIEAFKTQMKAKHDTMNQLRKQTISVRHQIEAKTESLTSIINDIQAGKKTLPQDMLDELLLKSQNIKSDTDSVKATSEISKEVSDTQDKVNKQDFNNALSSLDKVISRLQARLDALNKLNADLDELLAIANMAVAPAPVDSTSPVQNQTGTSATSDSNTVTNTTEVSSSTN
ncbi:hypothetical protein JK636_12695 [Clostridium sp. YIM B02515]|uniref:Uncharacterized protein n=1 Tax=Clostridium rhizosphaerae TaxID=2803861 RepID=A0ABS1TB86_9CLOT|nr:hypothetical protein [Clostridium rhizosphaerae]MBL4936617.1 hypothetical protein [Clostridium rhizosphaerae]